MRYRHPHLLEQGSIGRCACLGILAQLFKDRIQVRHDVMIMLAFLAYVAYNTDSFPWLRGLAIAYFCFWFAYRTPIVRLDRFGDPSYGIYLWGWPAQQTMVALAPGLRPFANFLCSLVIAVVMGYVSWRLIERPALSLKGRFAALRGHPALARWRRAPDPGT